MAQLLNIIQCGEENFKSCQTLNLGESQSMSKPVHLAYVHRNGIRNTCPNNAFTFSTAELRLHADLQHYSETEPCPVSLHR